MRLHNQVAPTPPAITHVQSVSHDYSSGASLAFASNNTAGNLLVALIQSTSLISDSQGNGWNKLQSQYIPPGGGGSTNGIALAFWYCASCRGGANTVTVAGGGNIIMGIGEFSGVTTVDQTGSGNQVATGATWTTNAITTLFANELLVGGVIANFGGITFTAPAGAVALGTAVGYGTGAYVLGFYKIVSATQSALAATGSMTSNAANGQGWMWSSFYTPTVNPNGVIGG